MERDPAGIARPDRRLRGTAGDEVVSLDSLTSALESHLGWPGDFGLPDESDVRRIDGSHHALATPIGLHE
jgi:nucleoid-associated protein YgaU